MRPLAQRLTRRGALGAGLAALVAPAHAEEDAFQLFWSHGRYLPYWRSLSDGSERSQYAAFLGDEATALAGAAGGGAPPAFTDRTRARPAIGEVVAASAGHRVLHLHETAAACQRRGFLAA